MPDEPKHDIDQVIAEVFEPEWYRRDDLYTQLGIGQEVLEVCLRWEIIHASNTDPEGEELFETQALERLSRGLRLHRDLGINWAGVAITLDLLDRIANLESTLRNSSENE